jgi:DNA-binding XRE family transcriptional regulator
MPDYTQAMEVITMSSIEEWREIPGTDGRYEVSNYGCVRSYCTYHKGEPLVKEARLIKRSIDRLGYVDYRLQVDDKQKHYKAHRLVAVAFLGESDLDINHRDGDKCNNFVGNLEYCNESENMRHAREVLGRPLGYPKGRKGKPQLSPDKVQQIRDLLLLGVTQKEIHERLDVSRDTIYQVKRGHKRYREVSRG